MRRIVLLSLVAAFAGCATSRPPGPSCVLRDPQSEQAARDATGRVDLKRAFQLDVEKAIRTKDLHLRELRKKGLAGDVDEGVHRELVLSAGGPYGAYGAGFLRTWLESGNPPTCGQFDFVTGVSTGSMMATHVFLATSKAAGSPCTPNAYARALEKLYRELSDNKVFRKRSALVALFKDSLYDTAPLHALVNELLTDDMLDGVAQQADAGRRLFAGAVNADSSQFEYFDLTYIAQHHAGDQRRACYVSAILASAAIPVGFTPVFMNDAMYIDGGARVHIFFIGETAQAFAQMSAKADLQPPPSRAIYGILNTDLSVGEQRVAPQVLPIALRTASIAGDQLAIDSAFAVTRLAEQAQFTVRWTSAFDSGCVRSAMFDQKFTNCLADYGNRQGSLKQPWVPFAEICKRESDTPGRTLDCGP